MLRSLFTSIRNEWLKAVRERMIFVILFVIPILVNVLLGVELAQNQIKNIPMAICDMDNSSMSRMIVDYFAQNETFNVKYYLEDSYSMENLFNTNKIRVGMIIPKDFSKDVLALRSPTVLMIYDGSSMTMTSAAKTRASEILLTLKTGILLEQIKARLDLPDDVARKIALSINFSNRTLYNPTRGYKNFLNIGLVAALIQSGIGILASTSLRRSEIPQSALERLGHLLGKIVFYGAFGAASLVLNLVIQNRCFAIPFRGPLQDAVLLCTVFSVAVASLGVMLSAWIKNELLATVVAAVVFVPDTVLAGYTWPVMAMPEVYQRLVYYLPFYHFADNLRDLMLKGLSQSYMYSDFQWFAVYSVIFACIGIIGNMFFAYLDRKAHRSESEGEQSAAL